MKKLQKIMITLIIMIIAIITVSMIYKEKSELQTIKSDKQLSKIYEGYYGNDSTAKETLINIITMPFSIPNLIYGGIRTTGLYNENSMVDAVTSDTKGTIRPSIAFSEVGSTEQSTTTSKDYSTTNIQVENVDEADITKTDGDYIYSISENNVTITDVMDPSDIKNAATIKSTDGSYPEDLILYKNELVVISTKNLSSSMSYYGYNDNTVVKIYDITSKENPVLVKSYELYEPYYTSRCINNMLYIISSGNLREEDDAVVRKYKEDNKEQEIKLEDIKYLKDVETTKQTLMSAVDLDDVKSAVKVNSYLIDISNAYVSENSIYLLNQKYEYSDDIPIKSIFGLKGIIGAFTYYDYEDSKSGYNTKIYKFDINKDGSITYNTKSEVKGKTINQYSLDEKNGHLRIALYDNDGTRVVILDEKLKQIGISEDVAKGETMYTSRFIEDKVYLVTYKTMDPLFVIDLSDETSPKVLGELHIPGYSTYLHPYDENHIIGIGMQTEEVVNRNSSGKIISTTDRIIGMKMALFDVSDLNNPIQISETIIGDRRTTSAILTNPKALLFSKEKELIAIPVNNYSENFEIDNTSESYSSIINSYTKYDKSYISEGYLVYNLNVKDGFNLKGVITHEANNTKKDKYRYYYNSKLLRGLYIDDNLYTISENAVKVNNLETLELVDELKIK